MTPALLVPAAVAVAAVLWLAYIVWQDVRRLYDLGCRHDRQLLQALLDAAAAHPVKVKLLDRESGHVLSVGPRSNAVVLGATPIWRVNVDGFRAAASDFNLGAQISSVPAVYFLVNRHRMAAIDLPMAVRPSGRGRGGMEEIENPAHRSVRQWSESVRMHASLGSTCTTAGDVAELTAQLRRAEQCA